MVALLALGLMVVASLTTTPVAAQSMAAQSMTAQSVAELRLVSQSPYVEADGTFVWRLDLGELAPIAVATADSDPEVVAPVDLAVIVFGRVLEVAELTAEPASPINRLPVRPVTDHPIDGGVVTIRLPIRAGGPFDEIERVRVPDAGVYPLTAELRRGEEIIASARTNLIRLPVAADPGPVADADRAIEQPIGWSPPPVSILLDLTADDGGPDLGAVAETLADHPDLAFTTVLDRARLDELEQDPTLAASFGSALGGRPVVAVVDPLLDPSSLAAIDRASRYAAAAEATAAAVSRLGLTPSPTVAPTVAAQNAEGAAVLTGLGVTTAIDLRSISDGETIAPGLRATPLGPLAIVGADVTTGRPQPAGTVPEGEPVDRAHRLLAEAALVTHSPGRPLVLALSDHGGADGAQDWIQVAGTVLDALDNGPGAVLPLREVAPLVATDDLTTRVSPTIDLNPLVEPIAGAEELLASYEAFYVDGPAPPASFRAAIDEALAVDVGSGRRPALMKRVSEQLETSFEVISLPENQSVTLAARSVPIPLTIESSARGARQVRLQFRSDKIVVAEDDKLITIAPGTSSIDVQVEARSLGASPLEVSVLSPDRQRVLSTTRFQVRSTAVPGLGLLISGVGLALLAVWWYLSIRRRRTAHPARSGPPEPNGQHPERSVDQDRALASDSV